MLVICQKYYLGKKEHLRHSYIINYNLLLIILDAKERQNVAYYFYYENIFYIQTRQLLAGASV